MWHLTLGSAPHGVQKIMNFIICFRTGLLATYGSTRAIAFWDMTPCRLVQIDRRFGATCCTHWQDGG
jgi:hypothetical protein